jgi:hypothetical protein
MLRRLLLAAAPFAAIVAVFVVALQRHLGEPARAVRRFEAMVKASGVPADVSGLDFVAVTRGPCATDCASYDMRVEASGRVAFVGHANTCVKLPASMSIDAAAARRLIGAAQESGVLRMPEPAGRVTSDGRTTVLVLRQGANWRRIVFGDAEDAPLPDAIARAIDVIAGDARWLPRLDAQGRASCS